VGSRQDERHSPGRLASIAVLVFVGYYLGAKLGLALTFLPNPISVLWPPNSILFAALLLVPMANWWVVLVAALPAHLLSELQGRVPVPMVLCWFVSNVSEAMIGAYLVRRFTQGTPIFNRLAGTAGFTAAAFIAPFLSTFLDSAFVLLNGWGRSGFWELWKTRFFSNVATNLTLIPLIVICASGGLAPGTLRRARAAEAIVLMVGLLGVVLLVFDSPVGTLGPPALLYLPVPFLIWSAIRFGPAGASAAMTLLALLVIWGSGHGVGPLATHSPADNAFAVQVFLMFVAPSLLLLAALMEERKVAFGRLRSSENRFAKAFRSSPTAISITRRDDGRIIEVNPQWEILFGYRRGRAIGRTYAELGLCAGADLRAAMDEFAGKTGRPGTVEVEIRNRRGDSLVAGMAVVPVEMDGIDCLIGNLHDITERRRTEELLRLSDERFQLLLAASRDAIYDWDLTSHSRWWSDNGLERFGLPQGREASDIASWARRLHPDDGPDIAARLQAMLAGADQLWDAHYRLRHADGTYLHVHDRGFVLRRDGKTVRMIGSLTDVTESRIADELNQKLLHASRLTAMGELTASIAHEINQPMSAILSNVDAAEMLLDASALNDKELRAILDDIRRDDLRAAEIIRHVRGLASKRSLEIELFDVNRLIREVVRLVAPTAQRRGIHLQLMLDDVPNVSGDRVHVQQVLLNLLFNGLDAMADAREGARALTIRSAAATGSVEVLVRDHGHGIADDALGRIFDAFYTTKKDGMGLGLAIARSFVEAHGGTIAAENNIDGGATFKFTLLAHSPDGAEDDAKAKSKGLSRRTRGGTARPARVPPASAPPSSA
jgi:PAS domain S-box-containing protein